MQKAGSNPAFSLLCRNYHIGFRMVISSVHRTVTVLYYQEMQQGLSHHVKRCFFRYFPDIDFRMTSATSCTHSRPAFYIAAWQNLQYALFHCSASITITPWLIPLCKRSLSTYLYFCTAVFSGYSLKRQPPFSRISSASF